MPKGYRLYLDTSVPNAYFDEKNLYRQEITRQFWSKLKEYDILISDLVIKDIEATGYEELRKKLIKLVKDFELLPTKNDEVRLLAERYVSEGIIPVKHIEDAVHIAVTTVNSLDILVSWNFEHIVKLYWFSVNWTNPLLC